MTEKDATIDHYRNSDHSLCYNVDEVVLEILTGDKL